MVAISGIFTGLGVRVAGMGLGNAIVNRKVVKEEHVSSVFFVCLLAAAVIYALLYIASPAIARYFSFDDLDQVVRVAGLIVVLSSLGIVPQAVAMRRLMLKEAALIRMASSLIVTLVTLSMAFAGFGYWSLIISVMVAEAFIVLSFWRLVRFVPVRAVNMLVVVPYFRYGSKVAGGGIVEYANKHWPIAIIGAFLGQTATGYFQMATVLARMPSDKIGQIFASIAFPAFSRIRGDATRTRSVFIRINTVLYLITLPMFLGLAVVADDLIPLLIGEKWAPIAPILQIMCVANVLLIGSSLASRVLDSLSYPQYPLRFQLILFFLLPVSMLAGLRWGLVGVTIAWATVIPFAYVYLMERLTHSIESSLGELVGPMRTVIASSTIMIVAVVFSNFVTHSLGMPRLLEVGALIGTGIAAYLLSVFLLDSQIFKELLSLAKR